ncbi:hypothetical protein A3D81_02770 [Candidatus Curtissbacteria bacterium RIFCSPHIGHO2_02_FULL_40_17]|uniref:YdbS-like PH domain-containing protein n=4 Tax=Candidatus Curtissiibacteriota TaxID=1752717 RepID=A0A1F5GIP5_9BACT|nr:MAG: hypothetical protein A2693_04075 [Candidatus Curtissbacteria bacterium RIFCSPHIGHO2_01_FULL_40_12]OGD91751.1 MAG: hypothetical protein A3D81_02770 [Candidatus Curtissbacteria bacterium RIFCSPHIGHO2_02_FULL_40_17]OGE03981.1 MAG: hypothetical protein A3F45_03410 [Candidatus Curtissbacteria bacterium RIFCSPHIGHO2_12_FULL_41_17]OGE08050.1 MAG: hypothetical protein A3I53_04215 [Candidatus Curtissbacteria bacterium RIFCSPLOWO2_02_FULL_40_13b]
MTDSPVLNQIPQETLKPTAGPNASTPRYLHPKAVWILFFQYLIISAFISILLFNIVAGIIRAILLSSVLTYIEKGDPTPKASVGFGNLGLMPFIVLIIFIPLVSYLLAKLAYKNWRFEVTEDSLRVEKGIIWKRYVSIPYERIQNIDIMRGLLARILGLSDLHIQTAGQSTTSGFSLFSSSEGRIPGLGTEEAEALRNDLIKRAKGKTGV